MPGRPTATRRDLVRSGLLVGSALALGAITSPWLSGGGPTVRARQDATAPTQTREAELAELNALRTQVAGADICTPPAVATPLSATATATPVPPTAVGVTIPYAGQFDITVLGIAPLPASGALESQGQLLQVNLTVINTTRSADLPPFSSWLLIDASGQAYQVDQDASKEIGGVGWNLHVEPGELASRSVVFDVLPHAGTLFTLESRDEPTFRVALAIESRG